MAIIVYTTPTCPYCHMVKEFLSQKGISFEERDVAANASYAQELMSTTGQMGVGSLYSGCWLFIWLCRL